MKMNVLHDIKRRFLVFYCLFFCNIVLGYSQSNLSKDTVITTLRKAIQLLDIDNKNIDKATLLIYKYEAFVDSTADSNVKGFSFRAKGMLAAQSWQYEKSKEYSRTAISYFKKTNNKRQIAFCYELLGVILNVNSDSKAAKLAFLKANENLIDSKNIADRIDIEFTLAQISLKEKKYDSAIYYTERSLEAIRISGEKEARKINLYRFLGKAHFGKKEYKKAIAYINEAISFEGVDEIGLSYCYLDLAEMYEDLKQEKLRGDNYRNALQHMESYMYEVVKKVNENSKLEASLQLKNANYKQIQTENELNKERIKFDQYLLYFGGLLILGLLVFGVFQKRSLNYKEKVNLLLALKNQELLDAKMLAEEASIIKSSFIERITHELRTPLNTITTVGYLLDKENNIKKQGKKQLEALKVSSMYLMNFINDVIDINLLKKENEVVLNLDLFNLKKVFYGVIESVEIEKKGNFVNVEIDSDIPELVYGDEVKIIKILLNLLTNANKFTNEGVITFSAKLYANTPDKTSVLIEIEDNGIGISKRKQEAIFEDFYQESTAVNRNYGGTGLGLAIVRELLDLHGSTIHMKSEEGKGTKISFILNFDLHNKAANRGEDVLYFDETPNLLLAEDNKINQLLTQKVLINNGFSCDVANNGLEAVEMCRNKNYDLILMDIMMPTMDGYEATRQIRDFNTQIPILALTALSKEGNKQSFEEAGIEVVLNKPINPNLMFKFIFKAIAVQKSKLV